MIRRLHGSCLSLWNGRGPRWTVSALLLTLLLAAGLAAQQQSAPARSTLRIYLARHGQTNWNVDGRTQGGTDIRLNDTGRQQAMRLKERLAGVPFDTVIASSLSRSRETAELVHGDVPVTTVPGLGERRFGKFEGRLTSDPETGPELQRRMWIPDDSLDGGESLNALRARVGATIDAIRKEHPAGSVLIVGHSYTNRMILSVIFGLTTDQLKSFDQANDELYLIELESDRSPRLWKLITEATVKEL